jgi:hypothetical protein
MIHHMLDEGVPGRLQAGLAPAFEQAQNAAEALDSLGALLSDLLEPIFAPPDDDEWSGVHILYGPPGAGKTMMCARLAGVAATQLGSQGVAWISYQDPRLGAWSQTQALAAQIGVDAMGTMFALAASIMLPVAAVLFLLNLVIGVVTKSAPQLNLFSFGFPITLMAAFLLMFVSVGGLAQAFSDLIRDALAILDTIFGGLADG